MTNKQRAQVVELLRCAADSWPSLSALVGFMPRVGTIGDLCWRAKDAVQNDRSLPLMVRYPAYWNDGRTTEGLRWLFLEAALRVEQGEWP